MSINLFDSAFISKTNDVRAHGSVWISVSDDPYFVINPKERLSKGWHQLDLKQTSNAAGLPKVFFDFGWGFSENSSTILREVSFGHYQAFVKLPRKPKTVRLDPIDSTSTFEVTKFTIESVTKETLETLETFFVKDKISFPNRAKNFLLFLLARRLQRFDPTESSSASGNTSYTTWQKRHDYISRKHKSALKQSVSALNNTPTISILMPVYNTPKALLDEAIQSVVDQVYTDWELCICNDASTTPHISKQLADWAAKDTRIKIVTHKKNGHISKASNSAFKLVTSDWVALLDHDDVLRENALAEIAIVINENPDCQIIYSDEDKIDDQSNRFDPHFKPDFSPELFRSMNYLNHLTVHRTDNIKTVSGWRHEFVGSQDYDLNLRIWECIEDRQIIHIPKILYHWRATQGSTALSVTEKEYTEDAALKALKDHIERTKQRADILPIEGLPFYRTAYSIAEPKPLVSLIIPTKDKMDLLKGCLDSIVEKTRYENYEIIVIDNNSEEEKTLDYFSQIKRLKTARVYKYQKPFNFSAINNFGVKKAKGDIIGLINNDLEIITPGWMTEMVSWAQQDRVGCVGSKLYFGNETVQHGGVILGIGGVAGHSHKYFHRNQLGYFSRLKVTQNLSAVTGACLFVRKSIYDDLGGLDEDNLTIAFNDIDFCLRVRKAGYVNVWTPFAEMYHYESISRGAEDNPEKIARFNAELQYMRKTWRDELYSDPYYSPNLSRTHEDFSLRIW